MSFRTRFVYCAALATAVAAAGSSVQANTSYTTSFDSGNDGWSVSGRDTISPTGGNPGANLDVEVIEVWGAEIRNDTNPNFIGNYSRFGNAVTLSVDVKVNSIQAIPSGQELTRDLILELVDYDANSSFPYASVWFKFGEVGSHLPGWRTYSVTFDPTQTTLPDGWRGAGDEDPTTYEPTLPPDRTFASVLSSVDEVRWTTMEPGWFYAFTNFFVQVDNPTITAVPEPAALSVLAAGAMLAVRRRRR